MSERIADAAQAALLLDPKLADLLARLGDRPSGAAELARGLGKPLSSVHAQLGRLLAAGVVEERARRPRAGRAVREYAFCPPWLIPFAVTPAATLRELVGGSFELHLREQLDHLARYMSGLEGDWVVQVRVQGNQLEHNISTLERMRLDSPVMGSGATLRLTADRARELRDRLQTLLDEYTRSPDEGGQAWALTILLTPNLAAPPAPAAPAPPAPGAARRTRRRSPAR